MYRARQQHRQYSSVVSILLRDGTILYAVLAISNISSFVLFMRFIDGTNKGINYGSFLFVVSSGTNSEMTHALSAILVSRMIFNLREAGTEAREGTMEWHSRMARESETMQFGDPKAQTTSIRDDWIDSLDESGGTNGGAEVGGFDDTEA